MWKSLYRNRSVLWSFVARDLRSRYAGTSMGLVWTLLNPILQILIYVFVFSSILSSKFGLLRWGEIPYWIYLCSGLLPWIAFQEINARSTTLYLENSNLIKKVFFPAEVLPAYLTVSGLINLTISMSFLLLVLAVSGQFPGWAVAFLPVLMLLQHLACFGLAMALSVLSVFFRDLIQLVQLVLMVWFWATPICYPEDIVIGSSSFPTWLQAVYRLNPFLSLVNGYRNIFLKGQIPYWQDMAMALAFGLAAFLVGKLLFRTQMKEIVDLV
ncbi:MAG TPA: ABC transporter permease [bacterium]|nr:ABC transporter permease [bacterium]